MTKTLEQMSEDYARGLNLCAHDLTTADLHDLIRDAFESGARAQQAKDRATGDAVRLADIGPDAEQLDTAIDEIHETATCHAESAREEEDRADDLLGLGEDEAADDAQETADEHTKAFEALEATEKFLRALLAAKKGE